MDYKIYLYTTKDCPYCTELKQLLDNNLLPYEATDVDENEEECSRYMDSYKEQLARATRWERGNERRARQRRNINPFISEL